MDSSVGMTIGPSRMSFAEADFHLLQLQSQILADDLNGERGIVFPSIGRHRVFVAWGTIGIEADVDVPKRYRRLSETLDR